MIGQSNRLQKVALAVAGAILLLAVVECSIRLAYWARNLGVTRVPLPYVIGQDYGPVPPWLESLLILAPDKNLIWRNRPSLRREYVDIFRPARTERERLSLFRRFSPRLPRELETNPGWSIELNSEGYRDSEPSVQKDPSSFRIVCLGDSWTFGMNVNQDRTYPRRLAALLTSRHPTAHFEVWNRGVLGYSSHQGLQLLRSNIQRWKPDAVVIAFAMNDAKIVGYRDKDAAAYQQNPTLSAQVTRILEWSATFKLLRYLALNLRYQPKPIGDYLKVEADASNDVAGFEKLEPWTRVSLKDYQDNITQMVALTRASGAQPILLYNELWENGFYLRILQKVAEQEQIPLVDGNALILREKKRIEDDLEASLHLRRQNHSAPAGTAEVVFRLLAPHASVDRTMYIAGPDPQLGAGVPNKTALYDDGTHGDQQAGDGVWSYSAVLPVNTTLSYVYTAGGRAGVWEGLDVPHVREYTIPSSASGKLLYKPIEVFGQLEMQADSWHTNASGYGLIANALFEALSGTEKMQAYLSSTAHLKTMLWVE